MFETDTIRDTRPILWLKRLFVLVIVTLLAIGAMSSYRAYVQVKSLELNAPRLLTPGAVVQTSVVSSGRAMVDVTVDLIQGAHSERLLKLHLPGNKLGFFDPRTQTAAIIMFVADGFLHNSITSDDLTGPVQFIPLGFFSNALWLKVGAFHLVISIVATIVGAALYKDAARPAVA